MPTYVEETNEHKYNQIRVGNLPPDISAKKITDYFQPFGNIPNLYLKRRYSVNLPEMLPNPFVFIVFEKQESVSEVMATRPHSIGDHELTVRRCIPRSRRFPREPMICVNHMLVHTVPETKDAILPDNTVLADYFHAAGGQILHLDRLNDQTVLIEFDDYDPVDVCCLARPHYINDQVIDVEKCYDEQAAHCRATLRQNSRSARSEQRSDTAMATINEPRAENMLTPTPTLSIEEQLAHLRSSYEEATLRREHEHEQLVASLNNEWKETARECIRLQRLTVDCKQEQARLTDENRRLQKLYSESLVEKPRVQAESEKKLAEARRRCNMAKAHYDKLKGDHH